MAKTDMLCPFSHKLCTECTVYRGRHYYLSLCSHYRGYIGESKGNVKHIAQRDSLNLQAFKKWTAPWIGASVPKPESKIRLRLINMETHEVRTCNIDETASWDWSDPVVMRFIDGLQITDPEKLTELIAYKKKKGNSEIVIYEGPRFMLLGGG